MAYLVEVRSQTIYHPCTNQVAGDFKKGEGKGELGTMPSMGITKKGREEARLNRLQKAL